MTRGLPEEAVMRGIFEGGLRWPEMEDSRDREARMEEREVNVRSMREEIYTGQSKVDSRGGQWFYRR